MVVHAHVCPLTVGHHASLLCALEADVMNQVLADLHPCDQVVRSMIHPNSSVAFVWTVLAGAASASEMDVSERAERALPRGNG